MASKLQQLQAKACQATQFVAKHGTTYYKQLMEQNKHYVKEPPTVETCNELAKQLFYTRLARLLFVLLAVYFFISYEFLFSIFVQILWNIDRLDI